MQLYSTNNREYIVSLKEAVLKSLAPDKGLYMPKHIPQIEDSFFDHIEDYSLQEIAYKVCSTLMGDDLPEDDLKALINSAINFDAPVNMLDDTIGSLELWHGPSLAFKDFGARFMAALMSYFTKDDDKKLTILVATSGDTGGAVAYGFYDTPGIEVIILYPSGKVSHLQEKQLTTLGKNIAALEIDGTFDDCQDLVKTAFLDSEVNEKYHLSSANSINIARLIPQSFYYIDAYKQVKKHKRPVVFSVPSGNFGNLTAGLLAQKMGLPVHKFIAATNINKIVPDYLDSGIYQPRPSLATISNAMDVGNPSNWVRIQELFNGDFEAIKKTILGFWLNDEDTIRTLKEVYDKHQYVCDPHGAIGYASLKALLKEDELGIFLETAHPAKFLPTVEKALDRKIDIPQSLKDIEHKPKVSHLMSNHYSDFKKYLLEK